MKMYLVDKRFQKQGKWADEHPDETDITLPVKLTNVMSFTPVDLVEATNWVKANKAGEIKEDIKYSYFEMYWEADCDKDTVLKLERYIATEQPTNIHDVLGKLSGLQHITGSFEVDAEL